MKKRSISGAKSFLWKRLVGWIRHIPSVRRTESALAELKRQGGDYVFFNGRCMIGDLCYELCYLDAYKKESGKTAVVIANEYTEGIAACFSGIDKIITVTNDELFARAKLMRLRLPTGRALRRDMGKVTIRRMSWNVETDAQTDVDASDLQNSSLPEMHRVFQYRLPETAEMTYPDEALIAEQSSFSSYEKFRSAVILNPYSFTMPIEGMTPFMEQLAAEWSRRGYTVYTNVAGEQECIRGTLPLRCSVYDFYFAAKVSACVISVRSGILDFCIRNGARYLTFYKDAWDGRFFPMYTLEAWKTKSRISEMIFPDAPDPDFSEKVNKAIEELIKN